MQAHLFFTRLILVFFLSFATPKLAVSQSKFALKGTKAFSKNNWKKFNALYTKQKERDSNSIDFQYLQYLSASKIGAPNFTPKNCYLSARNFHRKLSIQTPKIKESFCKKLNLCNQIPLEILDSSLKIYLNDLLYRNDTLEIQSFIINYHDSLSIPTVQLFILHYLQKFISVEHTRTVRILETKFAWHEAISQKDLNAILLFRDKFPNSFCDTLAFQTEAFYAFRHALQVNSLEEYQYFKDKYLKSKYVTSADSAIAMIQFNQIANKYNIADLVSFNRAYKNQPLNRFIENRIIGLDKLDSVVKLVNEGLNNFEPIVPQNVKIEQGLITINGAKTVKLSDQNLYRKTAIVHSYLDYLPMFDAHLIRIDNYRYSTYMLVNAKTGKKLSFKGIPVFCLRIDSSVHLICKIQNRIPTEESGFQIVQFVDGELKITQEILLDTSDFSQHLDSIYTLNGTIKCKISDFIVKSLLYVPYGTLELKHGDSGWKKSHFEPAVGDYQKVLDKDFLANWIKLKMPIFNIGSVSAFSKPNRNGSFDAISQKIEGCMFPIALIEDSSQLKLVCIQKPLKGADFQKVEKYKSLGLDADFIHIDLNQALKNNEIAALPPQFLKFNRITNVYNLNLFQQQYNQDENDLRDVDYCYLLTRNLLTLDETLVKNILTRWAVNFVQFKNQYETFFNDIKELPLNYTVKVNLEEYNSNNQSFTVRADKNLNEQLNFLVPADGQSEMFTELLGVNLIDKVNGFTIEHKPTMVFNKGSESDFTIFVNDIDAQKINKLQDKNRAVYMRIKVSPNLKISGKYCKGCDSHNCDEYKLRNCKLQFTAEQYEFSASPDFTQSVVLKQ